MDDTPLIELLRRVSRLEKRAKIVEAKVREQIRMVPGGGVRAQEFDDELEAATMPAPSSADEDAPGDVN
jgi:hypothetical protein